jgi:hypothetical protein
MGMINYDQRMKKLARERHETGNRRINDFGTSEIIRNKN